MGVIGLYSWGVWVQLPRVVHFRRSEWAREGLSSDYGLADGPGREGTILDAQNRFSEIFL